MIKLETLENKRLKIQAQLDSTKTQKERNLMGQFSTPPDLAKDILQHSAQYFPKSIKVKFLDPAFGTGSFFSALNNTFTQKQIKLATGFEIDDHYGKPADELWSETDLKLNLSDFTKAAPPLKKENKFNLIICNPPYVRHHHINGEKKRLYTRAYNDANIRLSGLSGLYCYFIALTHNWMSKDGLACWLIPSEFMDVNYGLAIKHYLLNDVTLLQIHRFDPAHTKFDDALVSSAVVWFINKKPTVNNKVIFSYGDSISKPIFEKSISRNILKNESKWTRFPLLKSRLNNLVTAKLSDFFSVKRGIATGNNSFFILTKQEIEERNLPLNQFKPILPSPRYLKNTVIHQDKDGNPSINKQLFVLDSKYSTAYIETNYPELFNYLQEGIKIGVPERYLCKNRKIWYSQEVRENSNFYCTYIGRTTGKDKKPFRFILNYSKAIVSNSYLILYPKPLLEKEITKNPNLKKKLITALNKITDQAMIEEGRVYGGGMYKLEPRELSNVPAVEIANLLKNPNKRFNLTG